MSRRISPPHWAYSTPVSTSSLRHPSGNEIVNLSLSIYSNRVHKPNSDYDLLAVTVKLAKRDRARVQIHDAAVRSVAIARTEVTPLVGISGRNLSRTDQSKRRTIDWEADVSTDAFIVLPPGEDTELAFWLEVPHDKPCTLEAVVVGQRPGAMKFG